MGERIWTDAQRSAIDAESGSVLVSAAAGSGKTSVLTERVVRKLTDKNEAHRVNPQELLVVTFTNAAASEMRARIYKRVNELLRENPGDSLLSSVRMRLDLAEICTIDSFCGRLVRENFHEAGISPDFRILDNSESQVLGNEVLRLTIEQLHSEREEPFADLCDMFAKGRDDANLADSIKTLNDFSYAHPFPSEWLDTVLGMYSDSAPQDTAWGRLILDYAKDGLEYCAELLSDSIDLVMSEKDAEKAYGDALRIDMHFTGIALQLVRDVNWDGLCEHIASYKKERLGQLRNKELQDIKDTIKIRRDEITKVIADIAGIMCADSAEHKEDMDALRPVAQELIYAVKLYSKNLFEAKKEINAYDFSDISSLALSLLAQRSKNGYKKTELAERLSKEYKEIMIDEYQDTNEAQDILFECLSQNGENLFTVGDVKQSIYRFRLAMPEIFNRKVLSYPYYNGTAGKSKIILGKNFRSRRGIIESVNMLFSRIMSRKTGEMDYTEDEKLICGRSDPEKTEPDVLLRILDMPDAKTAEERRANEADYAAKLIRGYIDGGATVPDKGGERKVTAGDFCILVKSVKADGRIIADALAANGLECISESGSGFFEANEISVMLALLRCADNPTREVDLLTVMLSPMFGFTPDELAQIRIGSKKTGLWSSVCSAGEQNEHFRLFTAEMTELRRLAAALPAGEFIRAVYDRTAFIEISSVMSSGKAAKNNLLLLQKYASDFDARSPGAGLAGFVRYIDSLARDGGSLACAAPSPGENAVHVMTIHKSKGLEFPFVILADTTRGFNNKDLNESLLISNSLGIGLKRKDRPSLRIFRTLPYAAVRTEQKRAAVSEELRVLYVAMTRAREKLIMLVSFKDAEKNICTIKDLGLPGRKLNPFYVARAASAGEWLTAGFMPSSDIHGENAGFLVVSAEQSEAENTDAESCEGNPAISLPDEAVVEDIRKRAESTYKYAALANAPAKRTASDLYAESFSEEYFAASKPSFLFGDRLSPAERGTATHRFLEFCDMARACESAQSELERLTAEGRLSEREAQAVQLDTVEAFFNDSVYKRAARAEAVYREKQFTVAVPVSMFEPEIKDIAGGEMTVVIGEIDMLFVENGSAVIVDYKTDRVENAGKLVSRYSTQLRMYADAVRRSLCLPVKECIIYSLHMKKAINVPLPENDTAVSNTNRQKK